MPKALKSHLDRGYELWEVCELKSVLVLTDEEFTSWTLGKGHLCPKISCSSAYPQELCWSKGWSSHFGDITYLEKAQRNLISLSGPYNPQVCHKTIFFNSYKLRQGSMCCLGDPHVPRHFEMVHSSLSPSLHSKATSLAAPAAIIKSCLPQSILWSLLLFFHFYSEICFPFSQLANIS